MQAFLFTILAITVLARSYTFSSQTESQSSGPFDITLVGELGSQVFRLDATMSNQLGVATQILTTDSDIGDLRELVLEANTSDPWQVVTFWLDGTQLSMADALFVIEDDGNIPCNLGTWASSYFSATCGKIIKFYFDHGYSNHGPYTLRINTVSYCNSASPGPINVVLNGTSGNFSFELTNLRSGLRETTITADIGMVYAVTFETKTHDGWTFDEVWLNNANLLLPADAIGMQDEGGKCQIYDYHSCIGGLQSFICSISITLYLNWTSTQSPTATPTMTPTVFMPTVKPTLSPTNVPTTLIPTVTPSSQPTLSPTTVPTTQRPTVAPSSNPSQSPTVMPTTAGPSLRPTVTPRFNQTQIPTLSPTMVPTTQRPTIAPSSNPSSSPTVMPTSLNLTLVNDGEGFKTPLTATFAVLISVISCCCAFFLLCANFFLLKKKSSSSKQVMLEMLESHERNKIDVGYQMPNNKTEECGEGINSSYRETNNGETTHYVSKASEGLEGGVLQLGQFASSDI